MEQWEEKLRAVPKLCLELHRRAIPGVPVEHNMCLMEPDYAAMAALVEEMLASEQRISEKWRQRAIDYSSVLGSHGEKINVLQAQLDAAEETIQQRQCIGCPFYGRAADLWTALVEEQKQDIARLTAEGERLREIERLAMDLVRQMKIVHDDGAYRWVWQIAQLHGTIYAGPTYEKEFAALRAALTPSPPTTEGQG